MDKKIYIYTGELTEEEQDKIRERVDGKHIAKVGFSKKKWVEVIPTDSTPLALYHAYFDLFDSSIHKGIGRFITAFLVVSSISKDKF